MYASLNTNFEDFPSRLDLVAEALSPFRFMIRFRESLIHNKTGPATVFGTHINIFISYNINIFRIIIS